MKCAFWIKSWNYLGQPAVSLSDRNGIECCCLGAQTRKGLCQMEKTSKAWL